MPVSLHTHSWYSLLEGTSSLEALLERAGNCGYNSLALTDSNNLYGAVKFTELAKQAGIRPLLGACLRHAETRCVALIAEDKGYRNLCRIISRLHLQDPTPGLLVKLLCDHAAGLHVLVDDIGLATHLHEAFGVRLWLEVVRPSGRSWHQEQEFLAAGRRLGLSPVASTAVHFAVPQDYPVFRLATAVRQGGLIDQLPARFSITPDHHLAAPDQLRQRFRDLPEAVRNTDVLAEMLRADVLPRQTILPPPRVPRSLAEAEFLRLLCEQGLRRRGLDEDAIAHQRLREELAIIAARDLAAYFLVVRDIARHARRRHYSMALRGSAGNSLVCYLLEITDVNPLRFDLPLERFLHPGRPDLPDIDLDFDWKVRDEVIDHVFRRYGPGHTAMISSHLFLQPRSAFREAAKIHGLSNEQISRLLETSGQWQEAGGSSLPTADCPLPTGFPLEAARWPRLMHDAGRLLGRPHHLSVHPGGIVITPRPIEEYVPLQRAPKGVIITQFEKDAVEHTGLVKIDLLGNRALATVDEARLISWQEAGGRRQEAGGRRQEAGGSKGRSTTTASCLLPTVDWNDPAVLTLLRRGDTIGVNQLESPAMRHLLVQLEPRGLDDVILVLALVRPGAASGGVKERYLRRRHGLEPATIHPRLESVLRPTLGFMIFEDDAARVVQALTGWAVPATQHFYKRVTKHQGEAECRQLAEEFVQACVGQGISQAVAVEQFLQLTKFQYYAFCKSHAVSYGLIAWQACALKVHQPLAFWTAALNNNQGMYPRRVYVEAIKRAGLVLCLPCVNRSQGPFSPEGNNAIRIGLEAIATLPQDLRARLLAERQRHGPFRDLADLCRRVDPGPEALATLIRCGALDFTGKPRPGLFLDAETLEPGGSIQQQHDLFPLTPDPWPLTPDVWTPTDYEQERRIRDEWALLGCVVGPPLLALFRGSLPTDLVRSCDLAKHVGRQVRVAGVVATYRNTQTAAGRDMQFISLEDEWGLSEITLFPGTCPPLPHLQLGPYVAAGIVEDSLGVFTVNALAISMIGERIGERQA